MGISTGLTDTEALVADEKVVDMDPEFQLLDPDQSQFSTILRKLPKTAAVREKVNWLEDQYFPNFTTLAAPGVTAAAQTAFTVAAGTGVYFRAGDLVRIPTLGAGEMVEVTSIATDTLTVVRAIGGVTAGTAASAGADMLIVGNAAAQGASLGTMKVMTRVLGFNYTQILRHPFGYTGTDVEIETYGPGDPMNEIAKKAVEHKRAQENTAFFGARKFTSASPNSKGYAGGLVEFIATNVFATIGTLTLANLDDKLNAIFAHGSSNKVIFSAPVPAAALSRLLANNWVMARPDENVYGAKVDAFITGAYGSRVPVITKKEWNQFATSSNQYGGWMVVVDLDYVKLRPLRNRGTQLKRNRQANDADQVIHEYFTEFSVEIAQEKNHGILKGITG